MASGLLPVTAVMSSTASPAFASNISVLAASPGGQRLAPAYATAGGRGLLVPDPRPTGY